MTDAPQASPEKSASVEQTASIDRAESPEQATSAHQAGPPDPATPAHQAGNPDPATSIDQATPAEQATPVEQTTPFEQATPVEQTECSRAGCRDKAIWALRWRNPRIHAADRRKTWVACDEHVVYLREFLSARDFPVEVAALAARPA